MEQVYNVLEESRFYGPNKLTFLAGIPVLINSKLSLHEVEIHCMKCVIRVGH